MMPRTQGGASRAPVDNAPGAPGKMAGFAIGRTAGGHGGPAPREKETS
jgi:hypothetical protein